MGHTRSPGFVPEQYRRHYTRSREIDAERIEQIPAGRRNAGPFEGDPDLHGTTYPVVVDPRPGNREKRELLRHHLALATARGVVNRERKIAEDATRRANMTCDVCGTVDPTTARRRGVTGQNMFTAAKMCGPCQRVTAAEIERRDAAATAAIALDKIGGATRLERAAAYLDRLGGKG